MEGLVGGTSAGSGNEVATGPERVAQVRGEGLAAARRSFNADLDGGMTRSNSPKTIAARFWRISSTDGSSSFRYNEYLLGEFRSSRERVPRPKLPTRRNLGTGGSREAPGPLHDGLWNMALPGGRVKSDGLRLRLYRLLPRFFSACFSAWMAPGHRSLRRGFL